MLAPVKKLLTKVLNAGKSIVKELMPMNLKAVEVNLGPVTLVFDPEIETGESGKMNDIHKRTADQMIGGSFV